MKTSVIESIPPEETTLQQLESTYRNIVAFSKFYETLETYKYMEIPSYDE